MAHGDNPADRYNHRSPAERDHERPTGHHDGTASARTNGDAGSDEATPRNVVDSPDFRAGAGGATDDSPGSDGGTLGTGGSFREQDI